MDGIQTALPLFDEHKPYIKGKLLYEVFHNPENLYSVNRIRITETTEQLEEREIVIVGNLLPLVEGEIYTFWGTIKNHQKFGLQYLIQHYRKEIPQGKEGVIQYLSSDLFSGIGQKIATQIVETLGENAIQMILENPASLENVSLLNEAKRNMLYDRLMEYQGLRTDHDQAQRIWNWSDPCCPDLSDLSRASYGNITGKSVSIN